MLSRKFIPIEFHMVCSNQLALNLFIFFLGMRVSFVLYYLSLFSHKFFFHIFSRCQHLVEASFLCCFFSSTYLDIYMPYESSRGGYGHRCIHVLLNFESWSLGLFEKRICIAYTLNYQPIQILSAHEKPTTGILSSMLKPS